MNAFDWPRPLLWLAVGSLLAAIAIAMALQPNAIDPVLQTDECQSWRDDGYWTTDLIPQSCGNNCTMVVPIQRYVPDHVCTEAIVFVYPNPDYKVPTP